MKVGAVSLRILADQAGARFSTVDVVLQRYDISQSGLFPVRDDYDRPYDPDPVTGLGRQVELSGGSTITFTNVNPGALFFLKLTPVAGGQASIDSSYTRSGANAVETSCGCTVTPEDEPGHPNFDGSIDFYAGSDASGMPSSFTVKQFRGKMLLSWVDSSRCEVRNVTMHRVTRCDTPCDLQPFKPLSCTAMPGLKLS